METGNNYYLGGYHFGHESRLEEYFEGGFFEIGGDQNEALKKIRGIKKGDRIALKTTDIKGQKMTIKALGIVQLSNPRNDKQIFVDWKIKDLNRIIEGDLGKYVRRLIGPLEEEELIKEAFHI